MRNFNEFQIEMKDFASASCDFVRMEIPKFNLFEAFKALFEIKLKIHFKLEYFVDDETIF